MKKNKFVDPAIDDIVDVEDPNVLSKELELDLYIYSNNGEDAPATSYLMMLYEGAATNTLGIMRALNSETGEQELLLVGVDKTDAGSNVFPLARVLNANEQGKYHSPDGKGGWFAPTEA